MAATTTTNVIENLKYTYGASRLGYLFNQESVIYNTLSKVKKPLAGRGQFIMPFLIKNAGAWKGIAEGGALPTALQPDTAEATFSLQEFAGKIDCTWKLIQDARADKFAFQQAVQMLDESFRRRILRMLNSDFLDNGKGRLGVLPAADNTSPIQVSALPRVEVGLICDVMAVSDDDTKRADSITITGVDPIAKTITTSGNPSSTAAGDYFVIEDTCDVTTTVTSLHTNGLLGIVDSANPAAVVGNFGAIDRTVAGNEYWQAVKLSNSGTNRPLTEDLVLQAEDAVRIKGGGKVNAWYSALPIVRRYHEMLRAEAFFALSSMSAIGGGLGRKEMGDNGKGGDGKTPYNFSGVPWYVDPYFEPNTLIGLDTSHFFMGVGENETPRPISEIFDNVPFFTRTTSATFEVDFYYQCEVLSDNPAAGVKITDISET